MSDNKPTVCMYAKHIYGQHETCVNCGVWAPGAKPTPLFKQLKIATRANVRALKVKQPLRYDLLAMRRPFLASAMDGGLTYSQARAVERGTADPYIRRTALSIRKQALRKLPVSMKARAA